MEQSNYYEEKGERSKERRYSKMIGEDKVYQELNNQDDGGVLFEEVWCLRREHQVATKALRKRSVHKTPSTTDDMKTAADNTVDVSSTSRPGMIHRKTDPLPMKQFKSVVWACEQDEVEETKKEEEVKLSAPTISEECNLENEPIAIKKSILYDERFLVSSYQLAKRRLSLPLSRIDHRFTTEKIGSQELDDIETVKSHHRSSLKQIEEHQSTMEIKKRRQSAWTYRRPSTSIQEDMSSYLSKRRMSELPALSTFATKRRNVPHMVSVPVGLKRKVSRAGSSSDYQKVNSASNRAKNEMLATLSVSSWLDKIRPCDQEIPRRKSCHTGFGVMALKKKEEKRLMVAHEILETEKNYIKALETLNEVFVEPLNNSCIIPPKDMRIMFPKQLQAIKSGHVQFMNELSERLNNWKLQGFLGDIFAKLGNSYHIDFMTVYAEYVKNFPKSIAILNKYLRNSQKFRKIIEKCGDDPRCERLGISAFLLTPIQRLPRYVLLLQQLSKYTEPNHPDSFNIEISLKKMIDIINILNSSIQNSTRTARNTSPKHSSRRRRKRPIFKTKEPVNSELASPRKSSDESELSETSSLSTPRPKDLPLLTIDTSSADQQNRSSGYGSLTNSEPASPVPSSSGSSSKGNIFKVILRTNSDSKKSKTRPLSSTEVEIYHRKKEHLSDDIPEDGVMKRSSSRDSLGSFFRQKFGSLRGKHKSSDYNLSANLSLEKLNDCRVNLFKHGYGEGEAGSLREENELRTCSKSENDFLEEQTSPSSFGSFSKNCNGSHEHLSRSNCSSDSEDSALKPDQETSAERINFDATDSDSVKKHNSNNNEHEKCKSCSNHKAAAAGRTPNKDVQSKKTSDKTPLKRKISKENSFTDVVKHFFALKSRSSPKSPESVRGSETPEKNPERLFKSGTSKEKISTV